MADKINYGIFPNPLPDEEGNTTYQVRHLPYGTMSEKEFLAHLKYHFCAKATESLNTSGRFFE